MDPEEMQQGQWYVTRYGEVMEMVETPDEELKAGHFKLFGSFGHKLVVLRDIERKATKGEASSARKSRDKMQSR